MYKADSSACSDRMATGIQLMAWSTALTQSCLCEKQHEVKACENIHTEHG